GRCLMSREPTVIYSAASTQQAHLLKGLLLERGTVARVVNDSLQMAGGELPLGWTAAARVVVAEEDAPKARQIAEDFDRQTAHEPRDEESAWEEADSFAAPAQWEEWPLCPACGERRPARCATCGISGTQFPLADMPETG